MRRFTPLVVSASLPYFFVATVFAQGASSSRGVGSERHPHHDSGGTSRIRDAEGSGNYELKGFFGSGLNTEISLRRTGSDKAYWIKVGEREKDVYVEKVDPALGTAVIVTGGMRYKLRLAGERPASARQDVPAAPQGGVAGQGTMAISGTMSGSGILIRNGSGTYTGTTTITTGTLVLGNNTAQPVAITNVTPDGTTPMTTGSIVIGNNGASTLRIAPGPPDEATGNHPPAPPADTEPASPSTVQGTAPNDASPSPGGRS